MSTFAWDPHKSINNKQKHGVSFVEAIEIWRGVHLTIEQVAKSKDGETRSATVGLIGNDVYTAIWTLRDETIRLISVRRARDGEKKAFLENLQR